MNFTSVEQSKKLLELGLDLSTADMMLTPCANTYQNWWQPENKRITLEYEKKHHIPCWSACELLNIIKSNKWDYNIDNCNGISRITMTVKYNDTVNVERDANLMEVIFKSICWLLEKGYLK